MKRILSTILLLALIAGCFSCTQRSGSFADADVIDVPPAAIEASSPSPVGTPAPAALPSASPNVLYTPAPDMTAAPPASPEASVEPSAAPTPSAVATVRPTQTAAPKPTPVPTPTPPPVSDASVSFTESKNLPLPSMNEAVPQGQPFCFGGVVRSESPILSVTAVITPKTGSPISSSVSFNASDNKTSVELVDPTFPTSGDASLTMKVKFEKLAAGEYGFALYASTTQVPNALLKSSSFKVVGGTWRQLISNNLRNNYAYALSFFGSRDEFMFKYKWENGRQITVEQGWLNSHMTSITAHNGKTWYVHKKAAPHFEQAVNYMKTSYVRVHGASDSGIVPLSDLVASFDGTLNTRFVTARNFVSHHAFGTAIDLNASMDANKNRLDNRALIRDEVQNHLVYNGIKEHNGVKYYDFTYNGSCSSLHRNVPTTVINYLLYELAFYRAGFGWGYYYNHACDAMHFTVSEMDANIHNTSSRSLRKVHDYA